MAQIAAVHGENQFEAVKIGWLHPAGAQVGDVDAMLAGHLDRPAVGRMAVVPAPGARGIGGICIGPAGLRRQMAENAFGEGRAADIAETDEQHGKRRHLVFQGR